MYVIKYVTKNLKYVKSAKYITKLQDIYYN